MEERLARPSFEQIQWAPRRQRSSKPLDFRFCDLLEGFRRILPALAPAVRTQAETVMRIAQAAGIQPSRVVGTAGGVCFYFFPGGHTVGDLGRAHAAIECAPDGTGVMLTDRSTGYARAWDLEPPHHTLDAALVAVRQFLRHGPAGGEPHPRR